MEFTVGTIVQMNNPIDKVRGEIIKINNKFNNPIRVKWEDGLEGEYHYHELIIVN